MKYSFFFTNKTLQKVGLQEVLLNYLHLIKTEIILSKCTDCAVPK